MDKRARSTKDAPAGCPAGIESLKAGVIRCLLDDPLTILWGNSSFFCMAASAGEGFGSLKQLYEPLPGEFAKIRRAADRLRGADARPRGAAGVRAHKFI